MTRAQQLPHRRAHCHERRPATSSSVGDRAGGTGPAAARGPMTAAPGDDLWPGSSRCSGTASCADAGARVDCRSGDCDRSAIGNAVSACGDHRAGDTVAVASRRRRCHTSPPVCPDAVAGFAVTLRFTGRERWACASAVKVTDWPCGRCSNVIEGPIRAPRMQTRPAKPGRLSIAGRSRKLLPICRPRR